MWSFNLKNKAAVLCNLLGSKPEFVFEQNGLTSDINFLRRKIGEALLDRNFNVPGINVEFWLCVKDDGRCVIDIFKVECDAPDVTLQSGYSVRVGDLEFHLFGDGSGSLDVYCGQDWSADRHEFVGGIRHHHKMAGKSKTVLHYHKHSNTDDVFRAYSDAGRAYMPDESKEEKSEYTLEDAEDRITTGLIKLLKHIKSHPKQEKDPNVFAEPASVPLTNPIFAGAKFHIFVSENDRDRMENRSRENHGVFGSWRLLHLGLNGDKTHPHAELMNEGFIYANLEFPGQPIMDNCWHYNYRTGLQAVVDLKSAANVFVVDQGVADKFKEDWTSQHPDEKYLTDDDVNDMAVARANTMVHINDYDGSFSKPVVIIGRTIGVDEIKVVSQVPA